MPLDSALYCLTLRYSIPLARASVANLSSTKQQVLGSVLKRAVQGRFDLSWNLCINFIEAHSHVVHEMADEGEYEFVIKESTSCMREAKAFVGDLEQRMPEMVRSFQTQRATSSVLLKERDRIESMYTEGELEAKEREMLLSANEAARKKSLLHPPIVCPHMCAHKHMAWMAYTASDLFNVLHLAATRANGRSAATGHGFICRVC